MLVTIVAERLTIIQRTGAGNEALNIDQPGSRAGYSYLVCNSRATTMAIVVETFCHIFKIKSLLYK